jgi:ribonuclease P protein component
MTQRGDYLRASRALRQGTPGFLLQARPRGADEGQNPPGLLVLRPGSVRVGLTCSRKIGNAVIRNRAKRRLRALVQAVMPDNALAGWDYVLVGRPETTITRPFAQLQTDLSRALTQIHAKATANPPSRGTDRGADQGADQGADRGAGQDPGAVSETAAPA